MLLLILFCICSADLVAPCSLVDGPRVHERKLAAENTINIEIRDGNEYKLRSNNSSVSSYSSGEQGRILLDYRIHTSFTMTILLVTSIIFQMVTMAISSMLLTRKPRYVPTEPKYVKIYQPENIVKESTPLQYSEQNLQCNDSLRTQEYI